ncbi:DUF3363 domain-containing protein, partial [Komagataeibacter swingsii]|uniref:DUF3363 domain-containing protein n=1 Tax=Komagataeibacter swingsii TaxID=215220 RepID=UPI0011B4BC17
MFILDKIVHAQKRYPVLSAYKAASTGCLQIPCDYLERAAAYDTSRAKQMSVRILSSLDLEAQITADGATWLDRGLVSRGRSNVVDAGFGHEVTEARKQRQDVLIVIIRRETRAYSGGDGIVDLLVGFPVPGQEFMEA